MKLEGKGMKQQRGGTILGVIIGFLIGLALALAVAVYITKTPIQFMNKGQNRSAEQDAAEAKKNKDWDPNAPLYGKNPARPASATAPASAPAAVAPELKPAVTADPLGDLANARAQAAAGDPFQYFVQAGAFRAAEDAESQRARLSLSGVETKVSEREQSGRAVFRVRAGPFDKKEDADRMKERLEAAGQEAALVRIQR